MSHFRLSLKKNIHLFWIKVKQYIYCVFLHNGDSLNQIMSLLLNIQVLFRYLPEPPGSTNSLTHNGSDDLRKSSTTASLRGSLFLSNQKSTLYPTYVQSKEYISLTLPMLYCNCNNTGFLKYLP